MMPAERELHYTDIMRKKVPIEPKLAPRGSLFAARCSCGWEGQWQDYNGAQEDANEHVRLT